MIESTDEMVADAMQALTTSGSYREVVAAVLAIVERDYDDWPRTSEQQPCDEETWSWWHFSTEQVDGYWIGCSLSGPHEEHKDAHTGLTWSTS